MSEKNVHGSQWTKSTAQKHNYDTSGSVAGLGGSIPASIYGGAAGVAEIPPQPPDSLQTFGNIRFPPQASLHHATAAHPPPTPSTVLMPLGAGGSNVPAPSGFVPPPFAASTAVGPTSAVTSVLTPNPYSVHSASNVPFGLEQFQHLNAQQFEFTKIMTAMNTAAVTMASVTASTANNAALSTSVISQQSGGRHHLELATSSGAITSTIAENVLNAISVCSDTAVGNNSKPNMGVKVPDDEKMRRIQHVVESGISTQSKQQILQILDRISTLKPVEKLLLYLRMPGEAPETDPLRHPQNPLGTRSEINHTINWVRSHLEHDPQVSIPKQDVYNEYITYCERLAIKPLSTADFGKVMKQVFPEIRPRRLGTRGHSRYCYAAMRKTTKLNPPELPHLGVNRLAQCNEETFPLQSGSSSESDMDSWLIIKTWAESMLNIKVENMKNLAAHIKSNNLINAGNTSNTQVTQKKFSQRDTKEKRLTGDLGPLKKRRKKKRKGSSSSESSCSQPLQPKFEDINKMLSPADSNYTPSISAPSEDEKKSIQLVEVKQEIIESPSFQRVQHLTSPKVQMAALTKNYSTDKQPQIYQPPVHPSQHHVQQQLMPMNLATEQRTVLTRAPPSATIMGPLGSIPSTSTAVKNLTPKIMDLSSAASTAAAPAVSEQPIKEEVVDDYNPTNIFCKKVRKAQQTKGFWANSPTSVANGPVTTITIGEVSPPISVITTSATISVTGSTAPGQEVDPQVSNYLMGPPAQITTSTSPSTSSMEGSATPKVASRNMVQLRAKKLRYVQSLINANKAAHGNGQNSGDGSDLGDDKDVDLPENLGLPRERMISICNMDKHELDDYFLPGQEENSQEQEAELLQYFQTGDAEEKSNSLDAAKTNNPTATELPSHDKKLEDSVDSNNYRTVGQSNFIKEFSTDPTQAVANDSGSTVVTAGSNDQTDAYVVTEAPPTSTPAVGSASASLALMSQKHQQQNKRKINLNAMTISNINTVTTRKNCIFLPISPNINNTLSSSSINTTNGGLFASPGLTKFRPKAALSKQQSLDCDSSNSDPMIGASRRRKSAYCISSASSTSASAPPSPSALQQQQQLFGVQQSLSNQWQLTSTGAGYNEIPQNSSSLLTDQNSLDLDLFDAAGGNNFEQHTLALDAAGECNLVPLSETQRSQSVPLSQLQRNHSPTFNRNFQTNFSTCTSVAQTPVPAEFNDFNIFSENSQPSISNQNHSMKLQSTGVLTSDTAAILDEVDVNDILSSPDFVAKFSSVAQSNAATTTCSSAGSSSGYSSSACTTFGASNSMGGIVSRSVPSTPLPHHQQNPFGGSKFYGRRRAIDEIHLSPTAAGPASLFAGSKYGASQSSRAYDISKSMPTTPITTPCFRYSPAEFQRDFLINGNTLDSITSLSTINAMGNENFISGAHVDINALNNDSLIVEGTSTDAFATSADADSIMVGSDILNNL